MLPMIDKSGRGHMAAGATELRIVRERLRKQYFAASFAALACAVNRPAGRTLGFGRKSMS